MSSKRVSVEKKKKKKTNDGQLVKRGFLKFVLGDKGLADVLKGGETGDNELKLR